MLAIPVVVDGASFYLDVEKLIKESLETVRKLGLPIKLQVFDNVYTFEPDYVYNAKELSIIAHDINNARNRKYGYASVGMKCQ